jgi:tryptophanyl-tRNA synthetase
LHQTFSPDDVDRVEATCRTGELGCVDCKTLLADHLIEGFGGFRERREELARTPGLAADVLAAGVDRARPVAIETLDAVRAAMHFGS